MCSKTTRSRRKPKPKPSRKTRPKTRSLQRDFSPSAESSFHHQQQQLNLFPLHPENSTIEDNHVAYFFESTDTTTATLNGLVWNSGGEDSACPSVTYGYSEESSLLERSALRGGGRDLSEEKWVCYEEVTSCVPEYCKKVKTEQEAGGGRLMLSLKLDYDEIMHAWSDKGPLYVEGTQIVPDLLLHGLPHDISNVFSDVGNVPLLRVTDDVGSNVMEGTDGWKLGPREARVLRYKKKRQNRLFSKRIRYQVRKLNAEKRPRIKGRFVKRS